MIVWLNGSFGAGKTSTATELVRMLPKARIFDSEEVGFMLRHVLRTEHVADFQDHPPWRQLVAETAIQVLRYVGGTLVVPQTIVVQDYTQEIFTALAAEGIDVCHFVLHVDEAELIRRINADAELPQARDWRLRRMADYKAALPWLRTAGLVVDTTRLSPVNAAGEIARCISNRS